MKFSFRPNWQWLTKAPLSPAGRRRLELCLGVVMASAAVVAMSTQMKPSPEKLATRLPVVQSSPLTESELEVIRTGYIATPMVTPELRAAVAAGDVDLMKRAYVRNMPLQGLLRSAAQSGNNAAVAWLLDRGADIHEDETTPYAPVLAADAHPDVVAYLRQRGASEATLEAAAAELAPNAVKRILATHPKMNEPYAFPIRAAAYAGQGKMSDRLLIIEALLAAGEDPNHGAESDGPSALAAAVSACAYGSESMVIVRLLLDKGAKVSGDALAAAMSLEAPIRQTALDVLLEQPIDKGVVSHALADGTNLDEADVKRVIKKGGVDWAWHDGEEDQALPMLEAARRGERDSVRAFINAGAPVDARFKGAESTLGVAIDGTSSNPRSARIVELLVEHGANVNRRLPDGRTPLFAAAEQGDVRTVNFLLEHGARVNDRVLDETALDAAEDRGNTAAARIIHAHGGQRAPKPPPYPMSYGGL